VNSAGAVFNDLAQHAGLELDQQTLDLGPCPLPVIERQDRRGTRCRLSARILSAVALDAARFSSERMS
jgi:hypothetical protein